MRRTAVVLDKTLLIVCACAFVVLLMTALGVLAYCIRRSQQRIMPHTHVVSGERRVRVDNVHSVILQQTAWTVDVCNEGGQSSAATSGRGV